MITPCTKERTRELEELTIPVENILSVAEYLDKYGMLLEWYRDNGFDTATPQHKQNARLTELMGFSPQYHAVRGSDQYRNAIWGFDYLGEGCVLYHSIKGLSLQVVPEMEQDSAIAVLDVLIERLGCNKAV